MNCITDNLKEIWHELPPNVRLVAVSKFHPTDAILEAYKAGQRIFGESKVQEMTQKHEQLPKDIEWHFIGHLQTNKVKYIVPYVSLIHSVDSMHLLAEINKQATKAKRTIDCLLQIHIAQEETKFGFTFDECRTLLSEGSWKNLSSIRLCGLMGMATNTDNQEQVQQEFNSLHDFYTEIKTTWMSEAPWFQELSIGMSHDYQQAIRAGSTLVRIGTHIFGERDYSSISQ